MIRTLRVRNFRSIVDSGELLLSNINVFIGANNVGKSSILYSILLLKNTLTGKDSSLALITDTPELDLGSYIDIIRNRDLNNKLGLEFSFTKPIELDLNKFARSIKRSKKTLLTKVKVAFQFDKAKNKIEVASFSAHNSSDLKFFGVLKDKNEKYKYFGPAYYLKKHMTLDFINFVPIILPYGDKPNNEKVREVMDWRYDTMKIVTEVTSKFDSIKYIAPVRERIPRFGVIGTTAYSELGPSGQNLMRVLASNEILEKSTRSAINSLNYWLCSKFKLCKKVEMKDIDEDKTIKSLVASLGRDGTTINLAFMGCGISQLVPVVVQTVLTYSSGCLIVEQPEIHLHPSAQADLADLFVGNIKGDRQFIIETHSEHFLLRLRRRVAEGRIKPDKIKIFTVEKKAGVTKINDISINANGNFVNWPKGFFEQGYQDALGIAEAGYKLRLKKNTKNESDQ